MRVHIPQTRFYTYPDVLVVCGKAELIADGYSDNLLNPVLIIEILTPSTEDYDKGAKFDNYRSLESLREYVLVSQQTKTVMRYTKQSSRDWLLTDFIGDKTEITLASIECSLSMEDIYDKVEFEI